jgi:hypothetical protein
VQNACCGHDRLIVDLASFLILPEGLIGKRSLVTFRTSRGGTTRRNKVMLTLIDLVEEQVRDRTRGKL